MNNWLRWYADEMVEAAKFWLRLVALFSPPALVAWLIWMLQK